MKSRKPYIKEPGLEPRKRARKELKSRERYKVSSRQRFTNLERPGERKVYTVAAYERDKFKFKFSFIVPFTLSGNAQEDRERMNILCWDKARHFWKRNRESLKKYGVENYSLIGWLVVDGKFYHWNKLTF